MQTTRDRANETQRRGPSWSWYRAAVTRSRVALRDRMTAAKLWLPALRELEKRAPHEVDSVCAIAGIERASFENSKLRITLGAARKFLREASAVTDEPLFGSLAGLAHGEESLDVFMRLLRAQPDFETARSLAQRFASLPIEGLEVGFVPDGQMLKVSIALQGEPFDEPLLSEYVLAVIASLTRGSGDPMMRVLEVSFAHAARAPKRLYRETFGAPVTFDATHTSFSLPNTNIPLRQADPLLATLLADHAESLLDAMPTSDSHRGRVAAFLEGRLEDESLCIESVSAAFGMSSRTLRRRLEDEGTVFSELLDDARREQALALLEDPSRAVTDVAVSVGFRSAGAFRKAFHRWTGMNASHYRTKSGRDR